MPQPVYHGTCKAFERFAAQAEPSSDWVWSVTRALGTFFSDCPRIAAYFTLKPLVIDQGFNTLEGSAVLRKNPWGFGAEPFEPTAQVLACHLPAAKLYPMDLMRWMELCETATARQIKALRAQLQAEGYQGIVVPAWDGHQEHPIHGRPCVEYHAATTVVFDASAVTVQERMEPTQAWPQALRPTPRARTVFCAP